jgi:hypothetical protein
MITAIKARSISDSVNRLNDAQAMANYCQKLWHAIGLAIGAGQTSVNSDGYTQIPLHWRKFVENEFEAQGFRVVQRQRGGYYSPNATRSTDPHLFTIEW